MTPAAETKTCVAFSPEASSRQSIRSRWLAWVAMGAVVVCWQLGAAAQAADSRVDADVLLKGAAIYDGAGSEAKVGDVAIQDGKIAAVGRFEVGKVDRVIDCAGLVVAPGFIDLHTHCDSLGDAKATSAKYRPNLNYLRQGCTTVVTGNCGGGPVDVAGYFKSIDREGAGTNVIHLVPHGSVRSKAKCSENRAPTAKELQQMKDLVARGMRDGAWGMSTGLIYTPSMYAKTDELIELSKVVAAHGGMYVSHIRGEGSELLDSVREAIQIGREAELPVQISHFKASGKSAWGKIRDAAKLIDEARAAGLAITVDQYPYIASSTGIGPTLFSATQLPGGLKDFSKRIASDAEYKSLVRKMVERRLEDSPRIVIASCSKHPEWVGKSLEQIAANLGVDQAEAAIRIQADGGASVVKFGMSEDDVRYAMTLPWVATGSDGGCQVPSKSSQPHPRSYGTFPRKIGFYAIGERVISLAHAIRSATGLPADIFKLADRGYLRPGHVADVVVFDPQTFIDRATFDEPHQYATGVRHLFIAGNAAIDDGTPSKKLYGRAIRHQSGIGG